VPPRQTIVVYPYIYIRLYSLHNAFTRKSYHSNVILPPPSLCVCCVQCRACGYVVCGECSKYRAKMAGLPEEPESRICCNCYAGTALTPGGRFSPSSSFTSFDLGRARGEGKQGQTQGPGPGQGQGQIGKKVTDNIYSSPIENDFQRQGLIEAAQRRREAEEFERVQARNYAHAYRVMRGIVPPDITSTNLSLMLRQGLPPLVAKRVWTCGALWLICMHSADIGKIHIADLRNKYATVGLDIVEMRAIWNILPKWSPEDLPNRPKAEWRDNFKRKLDSLARAEMACLLSPEEARHPVYARLEPVLVYNHRIPLDAKYDKIDTYGHVMYTGIDSEGNLNPQQLYSDPNPVREPPLEAGGGVAPKPTARQAARPAAKPAAAARGGVMAPAVAESPPPAPSSPAAEPCADTPSTATAEQRTPASLSPYPSPPYPSPPPAEAEADSSPIGLLPAAAMEAEDPSPSRRPASSGGAGGGACDAPPPPPPGDGSDRLSLRRRPPPLPAAGDLSPRSPVGSEGRKKADDSWLSAANMPSSPSPTEHSAAPLSPALLVPVIDREANTPPVGKPSAWKPDVNPAQRIGRGYGAAALADSDDELSQRGSPAKTMTMSPSPAVSPLTPSPSPASTPATASTPASTRSGGGEWTPTLSPLATSSAYGTPTQETVAPQELSLSDLKGLFLKGDMESINELFDSDSIGSRNLRAIISPEMTVSAASALYMQLCREPNNIKHAKETLSILVKDFRADVNYVGPDGKSGLIALLLLPELAALVINLGSSIFKKGAMTACPLSICLELSDQGILDQEDFVIDAFERSNSFNCMSRADAMEYFIILIKAGRHLAASRLVALNRVDVSASDASSIMKQCNFEGMKDSLETYELLEKLGGQF
jgi:hypothetical protein